MDNECTSCKYHKTLLRRAYRTLKRVVDPELAETIGDEEISKIADRVIDDIQNLLAVIEEELPNKETE